jgi:alkylhydroperoxidase/carboxymuconolactone decarboxylase family protein YurZ
MEKEFGVEMTKTGYQIFQEESPEIAAAFNGLIATLTKPSAIDAKTKNLLYIAMKVVADDEGAAIAHVSFAKKLGATREEIRETIILSLTVVGLKGINTTLARALETYDNV